MPYVVLVSLAKETAGSQTQHPALVEVYDGRLLVGKAQLLEAEDYPDYPPGETMITPVITWGEGNQEGLTGFVNGRPITVRLLSSDGTVLSEIADPKKTFGDGPYAEFVFDTQDLAAPSEFWIGDAYPNPFNSATACSMGVPPMTRARHP